MAHDKDIAALVAWDLPGSLPQGVARVLEHPCGSAASRALARNMLDTKADALFKDAGHYVAAAWATYLHGSGDLTLPRLKEAGVASGFLSTGRTRNLLAYLVRERFIELVEPASAATPARYALTHVFTSVWREHLGAALRAACVLEPAAALILDRLDQPQVFAAFAQAQSGGLLQASVDVAADHPYIRIFLHRRAGNQVIWALTADGDGDFPGNDAVQVSISALARRFHVSRTHIRRMFEDAAGEGLVSWDGRAVLIEETAREFIRWYYAAQILALLIAAARAVTLLAERGAPITH